VILCRSPGINDGLIGSFWDVYHAGAVPLVQFEEIDYFLADYFKLNNGVDLTMDVTNYSKVIKSLLQYEIDFALISHDPDNTKFEKLDLISNELFLVGGKSIKSPSNEDKIINDSTFLFREEGSRTRLVMENFILKNKIKIKKKIELTSNEAVKQAVMAGLGLSLMPIIGIRNEIESGLLTIIPKKGLPIQTTWRLIWLKEKKLSPIAESYLNYLAKEKQNIIKNNFTLLKH
jgi:DNA-binding transcriptional LysR family regulator